MTDPGKLGLALPSQRAGAAPVPVKHIRLASGPSTHHYVSYKNDPAFKAAQAHSNSGPRSLLQQVSDNFTGIPGGLVHLGKTLGIGAVAIPRMAVDVARGDLSLGDAGKTIATQVMPWQNEEWGTTNLAHKYMPATAEFSQSMGATASNLRHPTHYARAVRDGHIVDTLLQDVGNISIVAGPVAGALGGAARTAEAGGLGATSHAVAVGPAMEASGLAGGLERAAGVGRVVQHLGGQFADLPTSLPRQGLQKLGGVVGKAAEGSDFLVRHFPEQLTETGRLAKEARTIGNREAQRRASNVGNRATEAHVNLGNPDVPLVEGIAASLINGVGAADKLLMDRLGISAEEARAIHATSNFPEQAYTKEIQQGHHDYVTGNMSPEMIAKVDEAVAAYRNLLDRTANEKIAGRGLVGGALDPQQLGDLPVDGNMFAELERAGVSKADLETFQQWRDAGHSWNEIAAASPEVANLLQNYTVYPSPWRPAMRAMSLAREAGHNVPFTPQELLASGMERPTYMPGGESSIFTPKAVRAKGLEPLNNGLGGIQGLGSEQARMSAELQPYSFRTVAEQLAKQERTMALNEATMGFAQDGRVPTVAHVIDKQTLATYKADAMREAKAINPSEGPDRLAAQIYGDRIMSDLKQRGLDVLQGDKLNPKSGDFDPGREVKTAELDHNTIVVPAGVKQRMKQRSGIAHPPLKVLRWINKKFKTAVLAPSIRWQVGDAVGNLFMGWVGGGVNPLEMTRRMQELGKMTPEAVNAILKHPDFVEQGLTMQSIDYLHNGVDGMKPPKTFIGKGIQTSFRLNETINHFGRGGYLLAKVDKLLSEKGLSLEGVSNDVRWNEPDVQQAISRAVEDANKTMGAFDRMTPFERRWMREVFPFYAWTRHITGLAFRTAIDNPARMMWTMRLGAYGTDPSEDLPDWLRGSFVIPDWMVPDRLFGKGDAVLSPQFANPFNDVANNPGWSPAGIARSLSPGIKIPLALGLGLEPNPRDQLNPLRPITRPFGATRNPFTDALYSATQSFPLSREAINLAPTSNGGWWTGGIGLGPNVRYHSGQLQVDKQGNAIQSPGGSQMPRALIPLRLAGIPLPANLEDSQKILAAQRKRSTVQAKKAKKVRIGL